MNFTITAEIIARSLRWLIFDVKKQTDALIYNLCDVDATSKSGWADNLTIYYCKKQIDASFSCVCPVVDNKFRHNIVKVASLWIHSAITSWIHSYFDNVMMKFMINNRVDAWKTGFNLLNGKQLSYRILQMQMTLISFQQYSLAWASISSYFEFNTKLRIWLFTRINQVLGVSTCALIL